MADVITRLKLNSGEYDSKIKRATQGLLQMENECRKVGGTLAVLEKDQKQFVQSLGSMQTVATNVRGRLGELTNAYTELRVQYNRLTDEEKKGDFGQALSASLDKLNSRIKETKQQLADVGKELGDMKTDGGGNAFESFLTDKVGGALSVFGGNIMTKGFEVATSAAMTFVNAIKDAAAQGLEMAKQGEGIRMAFERLNQPGLLDELNKATHGTVTNLELMKAAVKFNDFNLPLNQMGTLLAFAQQKAKDTGQSVDYLVDSIVNGLGRQSLMILDNLGLSASEIKERMKQTGDMTTAVADIIRERMAEAGDYVETAADRAAQADKQLKDAMEELGRALIPLEQEGVSMWNALEIGAINLLTNGINEVTPALIKLKDIITGIGDYITNSKAWDYYTSALQTVASKAAELIPVLGTIWKMIKALKGDGSDAAGGAEIGGVLQNIVPTKTKPSRETTDTTNTKKNKEDTNFAEDSIMAQQKKVEELTDAWKRAAGAVREDYKKQLDQAQTTLDMMMGKSIDGGQLAEVVVTPRIAPIGDTTMGEDMVNDLTTSLVNAADNMDLTAFTQKFQEALANGASDMDMTEYFENLKETLSEYISEEDWPQIELAIKTGDLTVIQKYNKQIQEAAKDTEKGWKQATSAVGNLGNALASIEDPAAKVMGTMAQAIANVALGYSKALTMVHETGGPWGWIAFAATGMATMIGAISAIHSATGMANGGIVGRATGGFVPGQSYSGDNVMANGGSLHLDAGELVLNKAQQGVLADSLQGNGLAGMQLETRVNAEEIIFVLNNNANRRGYKPFIND